MLEICKRFMTIHDEITVEYDGGTDKAVETILKNGNDKREMTAFLKSYLAACENIEVLSSECFQKFGLTTKSISDGLKECKKIEKLRKHIAKCSFEVRKTEEQLNAAKKIKSDYKNVEIRRGLLQRWRVKLDDLEASQKNLQGREAVLGKESKKLRKEREKLNKRIASLVGATDDAAKSHEANIKSMQPKIVQFIDVAKRHKSMIEGLLLSVNLTTGLFKKREYAMSTVERKVDKVRSARAQIEVERRKNQLDYAILNVDSKRNAKILEVALAANATALAAYDAQKETIQRNSQEIESLRQIVKDALEERQVYEVTLAKKAQELASRKRSKEFLETECRRYRRILADVDSKVEESMSTFNDHKMLKLKDTLQEIKRQESTNRTLRAALAKARRKITKLEGKVVDSKLDVHYLAEYENHTE